MTRPRLIALAFVALYLLAAWIEPCDGHSCPNSSSIDTRAD
jgi:hypothetical protein